MRKSYDRSISLRCVVCGSSEHFEYNDDKTYVKCTLCNREYLGGEDELIEMNEAMIAEEVEAVKKVVAKDIEKDFRNMLKQTFRGNKYIKFE
ncbi:MAG: hypothetical protein IKS22_09775 [Bacteroidales bacterium]|nr:hypothetical protein [Bacteroidales bacterium]